MVGVTGFEPATSPSRTVRATKLRHTPPECIWIISQPVGDIQWYTDGNEAVTYNSEIRGSTVDIYSYHNHATDICLNNANGSRTGRLV